MKRKPKRWTPRETDEGDDKKRKKKR